MRNRRHLWHYPYVYENNIFLGYINNDPLYPNTGISNGEAPTVYYASDSTDMAVGNNNIEFGIRNGDTCGGTILCNDPKLVGEPAGTAITAEDVLDNFDFHPAKESPAAGAGAAYSGLPSTDYYGTPTTMPPVIGAVNVTGS